LKRQKAAKKKPDFARIYVKANGRRNLSGACGQSPSGGKGRPSWGCFCQIILRRLMEAAERLIGFAAEELRSGKKTLIELACPALSPASGRYAPVEVALV
jgi:hypothetical protein